MDPMHNNLLLTASQSMRTGNVAFDMLIVAVLGAVMSAMFAWGNQGWRYAAGWISGHLLTGTGRYRYMFTVTIREVQVPSERGYVTTLDTNGDNRTLINGIAYDLMSTGRFSTREIDVVSTPGAHMSTTRERILGAALMARPRGRVVHQGMMFEFTANKSVSTDGRQVSSTSDERIAIWSNDYDCTTTYLRECRDREADRTHPDVSNRKFKACYWYLTPKEGKTYVFARNPWSSSKTFESLFFARRVEVMATLDHFRNGTGAWAAEKQRTHTCNIFLWGKPGGGKSSMVKAIANYMGRHIFALNMLRIQNDDDLLNIVSNNYAEFLEWGHRTIEEVPLSRRIYLLEDLDCAGCDSVISARTPKPDLGLMAALESIDKDKEDDKKEFKDSKERPSLSGFLNALNGVNELTGAMFIISTNHKEKFDPAIYRPGRMDIDLELGEMTADDIRAYLTRYYGVHRLTADAGGSLARASGRHMPCRIEQICQVHTDANSAALAMG
jgi:hypothetical protein